MIPFVAGVLAGMAAQKVLGENSSGETQEMEPVEMREVSAEDVKNSLLAAGKTLRVYVDEKFSNLGETSDQMPVEKIFVKDEECKSLKKSSAQEIAEEELPDYIRKKLTARN